MTHGTMIPILCLVCLGATVITLGQASAAANKDALATIGYSKHRALQTITNSPRSFDIEVTIVNSINMEEGYPIEVTFNGDTGRVNWSFTVYAPAPGGTGVFDFCMDAVGEPSISAGDDMDDNVLVVNIEPNVCPCGVDVCFNPHLPGLHRQYVEWTGVDGGWYALVRDDKDDFQINVRTTAPMPNDFPDRQFITGVAILSQGHSFVIEVKEPYTVKTSGCSHDWNSPCLADGGILTSIDGQRADFLNCPDKDLHLPGDFELSSTNLPRECSEFGGRNMWAHLQKNVLQGRQLVSVETFEDWLLRLTHMVTPEYCAMFMKNSNIFRVQSDQAILRIVTPTAVVRVSAGINHRRAGKTDRFVRDLPEFDFWEMGVGIEGLSLEDESLSGLIGGRAQVVEDAEGNKVMKTITDYRVSDAEGKDFSVLYS